MQELNIYNRTGWVVGWQVGRVLYDITGQARAYVEFRDGEDGNVFSFEPVDLGDPEDSPEPRDSGQTADSGEPEPLGSLQSGYFRDLFGDAVAFLEGAREGPTLPGTLQPSPELPEFQEPPPQPQAATFLIASGTSRWSENAWNAFLRGHTPFRPADR